ncbi:DUF396-domain-containing protein [Pluteus cervinus]|uniref:DUF396-domain-containing protein n=1 Tax=Pluteus cervinus TaxID=181527 RepID=A0ACD3B0Z6_9AGAR|nr:DUF396-domain-containing protein [Pluteus cervinus]
MGLLYPLSIAALFAGFAFVTLSLASGLLYISELIEEHSRISKTIGQRGIYAIILLHVLLYPFDSLPFLQLVFSIACHLVYLQNFSGSWPLISLSSISFLASCALVIANHFSWFFYFSRVTQEARRMRSYHGLHTASAHGFTEIAAFFGVCVWLAPLFLFLSLSANDNALPTSSTEPGDSNRVSVDNSRMSLFKSIFSFIPVDKVFRKKSARGTPAEGLIAPMPATPHTPRHHPPPSPGRRPPTPPPQYTPPGFELSVPPRRSSGQTIRLARRSTTTTYTVDNSTL